MNDKTLRDLFDFSKKKNDCEKRQTSVRSNRHGLRRKSLSESTNASSPSTDEESMLSTSLKKKPTYRHSSTPPQTSTHLVPTNTHKNKSLMVLKPFSLKDKLKMNTSSYVMTMEDLNAFQTPSYTTDDKKVNTIELNRLLLQYNKEITEITNNYLKESSKLISQYSSSVKENSAKLLKYECTGGHDIQSFQLFVNDIIESAEQQKLSTLSQLYSLVYTPSSSVLQ